MTFNKTERYDGQCCFIASGTSLRITAALRGPRRRGDQYRSIAMQYDLRRLLDAATSAAPEATWIGLRKRRTTAYWHLARDGAFDQSSSGYDEGVMVEVLHAGQFGYAATPDLSPAGVAAAARLALL
ncbi:MAG: PmbA/TldA family metallopeptidase, partial [Clostridia bacterium]